MYRHTHRISTIFNFNQLEIINNGDTYSDGNEGMGAHFKKNGPHTSKSDQNGLK